METDFLLGSVASLSVSSIQFHTMITQLLNVYYQKEHDTSKTRIVFIQFKVPLERYRFVFC